MSILSRGRIVTPISGEVDDEDWRNQVQAQLDRITDIINGGIEFGDPQDPADPTSQTILAGADDTTAGAHNGTPGNVLTSFVELNLTAAGIKDTQCFHNLYLDTPGYTVPVAGEPNCRWLIAGIMHDGATTLDGTSTVALDVTFVGGNVTANSIFLRTNIVLGGTNITLHADHPLQVTLMFFRATRGE